MQTHELADALKKLASLLKRGPNVDLSILTGVTQQDTKPPRPELGSRDDLPLALNALVSLSRVDKKEWLELIDDLGLTITVRPRDASRDILGKVLKVLETQPEARERLQQRIRNRSAHGSPELARALSSLLDR